MQPWDQVKARLAELKITGIAAMQDGFKALAETLRDGEYIHAAVAGKYNDLQGAAAATDQRVVFVARKRGIFSKSLHTEELNYGSISSVEVKQGTVFASVKVIVSGNTATIEGMANAQAVAFADMVRQRMTAAKAPTVQTASAAPDVASQLEKLASLRSQGILTDAEFDAQKQKLLNS